jgi:6-phosphofructokinase 1
MVGFVRAAGRRYAVRCRPVPLEKIPGRERRVPSRYLSEKLDGVTEAFRKYALPLIGPDLPVFDRL